MGDWVQKTYWIATSDENDALTIYERLENIASIIRRKGAWKIKENDHVGTSILRFGFASPQLVVAIGSQKWGEDVMLGQALVQDLPNVHMLVSEQEQAITGSIDILAPSFFFLWCDDKAADQILEKAGWERVWFGAARVWKINPLGQETFLKQEKPHRYQLHVPKKFIRSFISPATFIMGAASYLHGLVALFEFSIDGGNISQRISAEGMRLFSQRIEGFNNSAVIRDNSKLLPETFLFQEIAWKLERHSPHMIWQSVAQRAALIQSALSSTSPSERRAGRLMKRRWGLGTNKSKFHLRAKLNQKFQMDELPSNPEVQRYIQARRGQGSLGSEEQTHFPTIALHLCEVISKNESSQLRSLAYRFAEIAYAASRVSYWMVRDGAPGSDCLEKNLSRKKLTKIWDGDPKSIASQIEFWATAAFAALKESEPAHAVLAAFLAMDSAISVANASSVWKIPSPRWIEAILQVEFEPKLQANLLQNQNLFLRPQLPQAEELQKLLTSYGKANEWVQLDPEKAMPLFKQVYNGAKAMEAVILELQARYRFLGILFQKNDQKQFLQEAAVFLSDLPSLESIIYYSMEGSFFEVAIKWTANHLAWSLYERGEYQKSLPVIEQALMLVKDSDFDNNIRDTKVRALLASGCNKEAFLMVHTVLARCPTSKLFTDIVESEAYRTWLFTSYSL